MSSSFSMRPDGRRRGRAQRRPGRGLRRAAHKRDLQELAPTRSAQKGVSSASCWGGPARSGLSRCRRSSSPLAVPKLWQPLGTLGALVGEMAATSVVGHMRFEALVRMRVRRVRASTSLLPQARRGSVRRHARDEAHDYEHCTKPGRQCASPFSADRPLGARAPRHRSCSCRHRATRRSSERHRAVGTAARSCPR
jgi:hypothetical protein